MVGITYGEYYEIPLLGQQEKNLNQYYKELNFNSGDKCQKSMKKGIFLLKLIF